MAKGLKVHLLIIDPQNDFMDIPDASLGVPGANEDMKRLARMVERIGHKLEDIHVTLDSHRLMDVGHPAWWMNAHGDQPPYFTIITEDDIRNGIWTPRNPALRSRMIAYAHALESVPGGYKITVWPPHCLIGTKGHNVQSDLNAALQQWSEREVALVDYVTKGSNPYTEHYGALMAEVPDPDDPSTALNTQVLDILAEADIIGVAGEALSHCDKRTLEQVADNIGQQHIKKFQILLDCCSPVPQPPGGPDFPAIGQAMVKDMVSRGMGTTTSTQFLA